MNPIGTTGQCIEKRKDGMPPIRRKIFLIAKGMRTNGQQTLQTLSNFLGIKVVIVVIVHV
jgi:hypothetical protein